MSHPGLFPTIRCHDTKALIDFLVRAFGFIEHFVVPEGTALSMPRSGGREGAA